MKLTENFTFEELTATSYKRLQEKNRKIAEIRMQEIILLAYFAEEVRKIIGVPMIITSAFRCKELNLLVSGSKHSQHITAEAIDFIPKGLCVLEAFKKLASSDLEFGQLIYEKSKDKVWIHISIKDENHSHEIFCKNIGAEI